MHAFIFTLHQITAKAVKYSIYHTRKNFEGGKIGEFGKLWALHQYFTRQLFRYRITKLFQLLKHEALTF